MKHLNRESGSKWVWFKQKSSNKQFSNYEINFLLWNEIIIQILFNASYKQTTHHSKCFKLIRPSVPKYIRINNRQSPFMDVLTNGPDWSGNSSEISIRVFIWSYNWSKFCIRYFVKSKFLIRDFVWSDIWSELSEIWFGPVFGHFVS